MLEKQKTQNLERNKIFHFLVTDKLQPCKKTKQSLNQEHVHIQIKNINKTLNGVKLTII